MENIDQFIFYWKPGRHFRNITHILCHLEKKMCAHTEKCTHRDTCIHKHTCINVHTHYTLTDIHIYWVAAVVQLLKPCNLKLGPLRLNPDFTTHILHLKSWITILSSWIIYVSTKWAAPYKFLEEWWTNQ